MSAKHTFTSTKNNFHGIYSLDAITPKIMAKFLETQAISNELMRLIKDAKDKIILVSPYLKVNSQIQERLKTKSKTGIMSEIVIVYGKSELKKTELDWIKDIEDLKVIEKLNLHAKCYINEDRAIICSMNLYDYSQQNNIEMGILITRKEDEEAYQALMEEINNIKINGTRKRFDALATTQETQPQAIETNKTNIQPAPKPTDLTPEQKLRSQILKEWRLARSKTERTSQSEVLTDEEIRTIAASTRLELTKLYDLLPKKKVIKYGEEILTRLRYSTDYTIGKVINVWYQDNSSSYDRVKLKNIQTGEEKWFDTVGELPLKEKLVAVKLNKTWFNDYLYLDN